MWFRFPIEPMAMLFYKIKYMTTVPKVKLTFTIGSQVCDRAVTYVTTSNVHVTTCAIMKARVWNTFGLNCENSYHTCNMSSPLL